MNAATEKKPTAALDKKTDDVATAPTGAAGSRTNKITVENATEDFREAIKSLDAKRTELVKHSIENIKPGRTFDTSVIRDINKIETKRNRLIVGHLAWLLKNSPANVHAIVHQIIEL